MVRPAPFKECAAGADVVTMPDLWKALGDVYGDADAPPVRVEPSADERITQAASVPLDDDLAAALSAALVDGPTAPAVVAPVAPVAPAVPALPPTAPAPAPQPVVGVDGAQEKITTWLADIDARQKLREQGPPVAAIESVGEAWRRGDDDILPAKAVKRGRRG